MGHYSINVNTAITSQLLKRARAPWAADFFPQHRNEMVCQRPCHLIRIIIRSLIHQDQTRFIKSWLVSNSVRHYLHIADSAEDPDISCAGLSLCAAEAFDREEWHSLWSALDSMGFSVGFIDLIKVLFTNSSAAVSTSGLYSACLPWFEDPDKGAL